MFEALVRDGAARIGRWSPSEGHAFETPLLVHAVTPEAPAPDRAVLLLAHEAFGPPPSRPHILARGGFVETSRVLAGPLLMEHAGRMASFTLDAESIVRAQLPLAAEVPHVPVLAELDSGDAVVFAAARNWLRDPRTAAEGLARARERAGFGRLLLLPGAARVDNLALLAYAGADAVDTSGLLADSAAGLYHTEHGVLVASQLREAPCACAACRDAVPADMDVPRLLEHNVNAAEAEMRAVRAAIRRGSLRDLVEQRVRADPELVAVLRRLDGAYAFGEARAPMLRRAGMRAASKESLTRPECERFRRRLLERYRKPASARILLLLPCSATKPYLRSPSHRLFRDAVQFAGAEALVHEVMLTSPLGLVPRDLELTYPAAHYDVPVTGHWDRDEEEMIRGQLRGLLARNAYDAVVAHLGRASLAIVEELLPAGSRLTAVQGRPTSGPSLTALREGLVAARRGLAEAPIKQRRLDDAVALARWQLGEAAAAEVFRGASKLVGRWPDCRVLAGAEHRATLVPERGLLSLTFAGAGKLAVAGGYTVEIEDFTPSGSVFAVGVEGASPDIRPGDEVACVHNGELRASGIALMTGEEMAECSRGEAVKVRHHA